MAAVLATMPSTPSNGALTIAKPSQTDSPPTAASYPPFRRRTLGRAASPPTWAYYEQIPLPEDGDSSSEDGDEDGGDAEGDDAEDTSDHDGDSSSERSDEDDGEGEEDDEVAELDMEFQHVGEVPLAEDKMDVDFITSEPAGNDEPQCDQDEDEEAERIQSAKARAQAKGKGKERAVEQEERPRKGKKKHHRHHRQPAYRPILTIHRSQGFVWNQDLFVPSYIKDRYMTSTSPPGESCISLTNMSPPNMNPYDVEVVEIRVTGSELDDLMF